MIVKATGTRVQSHVRQSLGKMLGTACVNLRTYGDMGK